MTRTIGPNEALFREWLEWQKKEGLLDIQIDAAGEAADKEQVFGEFMEMIYCPDLGPELSGEW